MFWLWFTINQWCHNGRTGLSNMKTHPWDFLLMKQPSVRYYKPNNETKKKPGHFRTWGSTRHSCSCPQTIKSKNRGRKCSFIAFFGFVFTLKAKMKVSYNSHTYLNIAQRFKWEKLTNTYSVSAITCAAKVQLRYQSLPVLMKR